MFIQHTAFLLDKGSQHRRRGILPPAVSIYLMNETRRKPTTGRQSPTLFDKWHGIFYMPSRIDEAGHTKAFDYPVAEHWGESQRAKRSLVGFEPTSAHTYESEIQRSTTYATPTPRYSTFMLTVLMIRYMGKARGQKRLIYFLCNILVCLKGIYWDRLCQSNWLLSCLVVYKS